MTNSSKAGMLSLILCIAFTLLTLKLLNPPKAPTADAPAESFSAERASRHLAVIAQEPHSLGTPENQKVIRYITEQLEYLGLTVTIQDTLIHRAGRDNNIRISRVQNIIGTLKGRDNSKAVMLMAHHDSQPNTPGAADDGSGVVAILESIRAIKADLPLKNDLFVLITDAEEIGLMGAKAFVDFHPLLQETGVVINLEARGNQGVSMGFEMNTENGWIVREFAKSAPFPFANSIAYEIYRVMPNDTDFSEFKKTSVAGINSACLEGFVNYHSMTDRPENMDLNTLQHAGANMLGMLRHFGNLDIKNTKQPDVIFFNPIGSWFVVFPAAYDVGFIGLTILLFLALLIIGIRKEKIKPHQIFIGTGYFLVALTVAGIGAYLLLELILKLYPHYTAFYANNFYNSGYYFLFFSGWTFLIYALTFGFQARMNGLSLSLGGVLMLVMALFGLTFSLPTGEYILYYPLIFFLGFQLVLVLTEIDPEKQPGLYGLLQFLSVAPAIGLWLQMIYLLFITFGLTAAVIAPLIILCFLLTLLIPVIIQIGRWNKWLLMAFAGLMLLIGFAGAHLNAGWSEKQPQQIQLMYARDMDLETSVWATYKKYHSNWVKKYVKAENPTSLDNMYPGWNRKYWQSPAPNIDWRATDLQLVRDSLTADSIRVIDLFATLPDFKNSIEIFLETGEGIQDVRIDGYAVPIEPKDKDGTLFLNFFAPRPEGFSLQLRTKNSLQKIRLIDRTIGLPQTLLDTPLPSDMIHGPGSSSNVTLLKKSYEF